MRCRFKRYRRGQKVQRVVEGMLSAIRCRLTAYCMAVFSKEMIEWLDIRLQTSDFPAPLLYGPREALINLQNQISYAFLSNAAS